MTTSNRTAESSPSWSLLWIIFTVSALGLLTTVYIYYNSQAERIHQAALTQLSSVAELRVSELAQWHQERLGDARFYQGNADFVRRLQDFLSQPRDSAPPKKLSDWIHESQISHHYSIVLLDAAGEVRYTDALGKLPDKPLLTETLANPEVHLLDFYQPVDQGSPRLAIVVPLFRPDATSTRAGSMLWILDPQDYLYPLIKHWPFQSESAETVLLRRENDYALCLSPLRSSPGAALTVRIPVSQSNSVAVQAVTGSAAPILGDKIDGKRVMAVAQAIPETPWVLLVSLSRHEIEGPLYQRLQELIITGLALLAAAAAAIAFLWRTQHARFLRERLATAEKLQETETRFRTLFNSVPDAVMLLETPDQNQRPGRFVEVNDIACQRLGYTREELTRMTPLDIDSPAAGKLVSLRVEKLVTEGAATWEGEHITKDGRIIPVEINARVVELDNRKLWMAISRDITDRQNNRIQLDRLNRTLAVSNGINQAILRERDQHALLTTACRIAVEEGGFRMVWIGLVNADCRSVVPTVHAGEIADYLTGITINLSAPLATAGPASSSIRNLAPAIRNDIRDHTGIPWADRALRLGYLSCASFPLIVAGEARGMVALYAGEAGVFADDEVKLLDDMARNLALAMELAEHEVRRREAEDALKNSEQRFRTILENMPGISVQGFDSNHRTIFWNQASTDLYGWSADEAIGRRPGEFFIPSLLDDELRTDIDAWFAGGAPLPPGEFNLLHKDGTPISVYTGFFLLKNDQGKPEIYALSIDLTARNAAQAELHLLHAALEATPSAWVITNAAGIIQWVNPAFTNLTGYSSEEALGRTPHLLYSGQQAESFYDTLWTTIKAGQIWSGELQNRRRDGSIYHEHMMVAPVRDASQRITHFVAMKQDITEQKRLEHQLLRAQRMEGIGLLAGGIAHDLNNVLAPILLSVELLRLRFPGPENKSTLDIIESSTRRGSGVVRQVLTFARGIEGERLQLRPKDLLREIAFIAEETFPRSINVVRNVDEKLPAILGDPTQIHQILLNLAVNARDAMPKGGILSLEADAVEVTQTYSRFTGDITPGPYICLSVQDTGMGIPSDHIDKIFEPFFTTKGVGQGTGLGLSAVFGIVRSHNGFLEVTSTVGQGSRFQIYLPALPLQDSASPIPVTNLKIQGKGRGILVCDDEETIRLVTGAVLGNAGFVAFTAANGQEARRLHEQHHKEIHLALIDIMMPMETGDQVAIGLRKITPGLPVLFSTGMIGDAEAEKILKEQLRLPDTALLAKPYDEHTLLLNIVRLLNEHGHK